ncbi:MAG: LipA a lipoprotein [Tardiphaga sp.]|jgi:surface antigen|nr:LipA a lipoprotein [Tardiphaga sp.]
MLKSNAVLLLAATLALGGCDITGSEGGAGLGTGTLTRAYSSTKSAVGLASEAEAASAVTNAAFSGLIGAKLGAALNDEDRRLALAAQIDALDHGAPGAPVPWRNPASGRFGNIVAGPAYDQKGAQCRGFSHTITVAGELKTARGTACRSLDGAWTAAG